MYPNGVGDDGTTVEDDNDGWRCMDIAGSRIVYSLEDLPEGIIEELDTADSAETLLSISSVSKLQDNGRVGNDGMAGGCDGQNCYNGENKIKVHQGATVSIIRGNQAQELISQHEERRLAPTTGTSTVLVVRVRDPSGAQPSKTAAQLSDDIFGTNGDPHNLVGKLHICSLFIFFIKIRHFSLLKLINIRHLSLLKLGIAIQRLL